MNFKRAVGMINKVDIQRLVGKLKHPMKSSPSAMLGSIKAKNGNPFQIPATNNAITL